MASSQPCCGVLWGKCLQYSDRYHEPAAITQCEWSHKSGDMSKKKNWTTALNPCSECGHGLRRNILQTWILQSLPSQLMYMYIVLSISLWLGCVCLFHPGQELKGLVVFCQTQDALHVHLIFPGEASDCTAQYCSASRQSALRRVLICLFIIQKHCPYINEPLMSCWKSRRLLHLTIPRNQEAPGVDNLQEWERVIRRG